MSPILYVLCVSWIICFSQNSRKEIKIGKEETKRLLCSDAVIVQSEKPKGLPDGLE